MKRMPLASLIKRTPLETHNLQTCIKRCSDSFNYQVVYKSNTERHTAMQCCFSNAKSELQGYITIKAETAL